MHIFQRSIMPITRFPVINGQGVALYPFRARQDLSFCTLITLRRPLLSLLGLFPSGLTWLSISLHVYTRTRAGRYRNYTAVHIKIHVYMYRQEPTSTCPRVHVYGYSYTYHYVLPDCYCTVGSYTINFLVFPLREF